MVAIVMTLALVTERFALRPLLDAIAVNVIARDDDIPHNG
jgi:hypothetical protein